ncbi:TonB-dependent receptor plug domain-containing protein, partial [Pseudoxanthomonas sp.]|uniref:STN domain-containing protein n=1 Tax=Pseudoxanthomonas sp. TaxID=1871049 RepID=UPI003F7CE16B
MLASLCSMACGGALATTPVPTFREFDIPAKPLDTALIDFSRQSGLQVFSSCAGSRNVAAVQGRWEPIRALERMLAGTGCRFSVRDNGTVSIQPQAVTEPAPMVLPGIKAPPRTAEIPMVRSMVGLRVTARRRDERQIDVPIAMTAVTGEQIDAMGISKIAEIIGMTPGAGAVDNGMGFLQVQIRGVSSSLGGNDNGYYLDDIPFTGVTVPWYPEVRSWDIDRVEILKGPQGTLFGEGSMG